MPRGDILIVNLPTPSGNIGHEQLGDRPAIVVQADATNSNLPTTMIVPVTSNLSALRFPHTFLVDPTVQNGLTRPSVVMVFQLRAIDKTRLSNRIGQLEESHLQQLANEIRRLLDV